MEMLSTLHYSDVYSNSAALVLFPRNTGADSGGNWGKVWGCGSLPDSTNWRP